ncbi:MAG: hypothetical protein HOW73_44250 [Polyangiaceae bacterium]|nr:hypothetical protein [Polyangiaceae bacterium]
MTGLADGTCSFIVAEEPAGECPDVFGDCLTGTCTGTDASCEVRAAGSDCGTVTCTNGTVHQPQCNSTGQCDQTEDTFCNGHICNGNICDDDCNNQTNQCISGYDCEDSSDVCLKLVGQPCGGNTECLNGQCVDGFCCESTCTGTCKRCDMANTGQNNGLCRNTTNNLDPDNECTNECNGSGACE